MPFKKATKLQARIRLALVGPAGSGKTYTALRIAKAMGGRIAVVDTEHGSSAKYADEFDFDLLEMDVFSLEKYVAAIKEAEAAGYDTIILDSISHAWAGRGGALEEKEKLARSKDYNDFSAWAVITPKHTAFIEAMLGSKAHVIATMRSKTEYSMEKDDRGRTVVTKLGMAPVQREGVDYEFDVVIDLSHDHVGTVTKTRCRALDGGVYEKPGEDVAKIVLAWLAGSPAPEKPTPKPEEQSFACSKCGHALMPFTARDGKEWTVDGLVDYCNQSGRRPTCGNCLQEEALEKAEKKAATQNGKGAQGGAR